MNDVLDLLEKLNFSRTEAAVYVNVLKNPKSSGYQIAKNLNMSRSSVYAALDNLYKKGCVFVLPGDIQIYKAENPKTLINNMKDNFIRTTDILEKKLDEIKNNDLEERFLNIEGYDNIIAKAKELLLTAKKEVYINTDFDIQIFKDEMSEITKRGVRVIIFSFSKLNGKGLALEIYNHCDERCYGNQTRIMLVVDCQKTLIADSGKHREKFLGTFTENTLLASIISEHIHHDIYFLKLKKKYKKDIVVSDIMINTILENR